MTMTGYRRVAAECAVHPRGMVITSRYANGIGLCCQVPGCGHAMFLPEHRMYLVRGIVYI